MDGVVTHERIRAAIDDAVHALQVAVLVATPIETDQPRLRRALDRAAHALATLKPATDGQASKTCVGRSDG